jgi:hypothetical protein
VHHSSYFREAGDRPQRFNILWIYFNAPSFGRSLDHEGARTKADNQPYIGAVGGKTELDGRRRSSSNGRARTPVSQLATATVNASVGVCMDGPLCRLRQFYLGLCYSRLGCGKPLKAMLKDARSLGRLLLPLDRQFFRRR